MHSTRKGLSGLGATAIAAATMTIAAAMTASAFAQEEVRVSAQLDGQAAALFPAAIQLEGDTMMVTVRPLMEELGYTIGWDAATGKAVIYKPKSGVYLELMPNSAAARKIDGNEVRLPVKPYIDSDGQLWAPLRPLVEWSGGTIKWDSQTLTATIIPGTPLPVPFSLYARSDKEGMSNPGPLQSYIEKRWNATIRFIYASPLTFKDKSNLMIASGDPANLMMSTQVYRFDDELFRSIYTELTPYLQERPYLLEQTEENLARLRTIDGGLYALPVADHPNDASFPAIRTDWLDRLGLMQPRTMDELYLTLERFRDQDADGNGKHDTMPIAAYTDRNGLGSLDWVEQVYTGSPDRFSLQDGELVDHAVGAGEREALQWLSRAYADGLISKEFAVATREQALALAQKQQAGLAVMTMEEAAQRSLESMQDELKMNHQAWLPLAGLAPRDGEKAVVPWRTAADAKMYAIPRFATPDQVRTILYVYEEAMKHTRSQGWELDGFGEDDIKAAQFAFGDAELTNGSVAKLPADLSERYLNTAQAWEKVSYRQTEAPLAALAVADRPEYAQINKKLFEMKIKVIMGAVSLTEWDGYIEELKASDNYRQMMEEMSRLAVR